MSDPGNSHSQAAIQYLDWAVEEIEKAGNREAARHARAAINVLQEAITMSRDQGSEAI